MADNTLGTDAFEQLVSLLDYPMYVVTTRTGEESAGCLVGFTSQVSIRPRRFLVGLSKRNHTYRVARRSEHLAVHLLPRRHRELARLFGSETGDHVDKVRSLLVAGGTAGSADSHRLGRMVRR